MAEADWTPTLKKKFRSKKKCKALGLKAVLNDDDTHVPQEYAMAATMCTMFTQQECTYVGQLAKWIMTTWEVFRMNPAMYDHDPNTKPYYLNCRDFIANYVFPVQGINLMVVDMCGQPILCTTKPYKGFGSGPMGTTAELKAAEVEITGGRTGYFPAQFTFLDDEGNKQTHSDTGADGLLDLMCNCDRFSTQQWTSTNSQAKWKDVVQASVIPFSGIPNFKVVKKEQFGGTDGSSMRMLGLESEKFKESLCAYKFGITSGTEYGYIIMNCADRSQTDELRLKKGTFRTAGYRMSEALKLMSEWEIFEVDEGTTKTFIPNIFNAALDVFESNGSKECKYDQAVWDGAF